MSTQETVHKAMKANQMIGQLDNLKRELESNKFGDSHTAALKWQLLVSIEILRNDLIYKFIDPMDDALRKIDSSASERSRENNGNRAPICAENFTRG